MGSHDNGDEAVREGKALLCGNRFDQAEQAFAQALARDPNHAEALHGRVLCLRRRRAYDQAQAALDEALARHPGDQKLQAEQALLYIARAEYVRALQAFPDVADDAKAEERFQAEILALRKVGRPDEAAALIAKALDRFPSSALVWAELGWLHFEKGEFEQAIAPFTKALEYQVDVEGALQGKIASLRMTGRLPEAEDLFRQARTKYPRHVGILDEGGWLHFAGRRYDEAVRAFEEALTHEPNDEGALLGQIGALRRACRFEDAECRIGEALRRVPGSVSIRNERGWLFFDLKRYREAVAAFQDALALDPANEGTLQGRVAACRLQRQFDVAERLVADALERFPNSLSLRTERGWLYLDQRMYPQAGQAFEEALARNGDDEGALLGRVAACRLQRQFDVAQRLLEDAVRRAPGSVSIRNERGWLFSDMRQYDEAIRAFEEALTRAPDDEGALQGRIAAVRLQGRGDDAEALIAEALERLPESAAMWSERGWLRFDQGRFEEAADAFAHAARRAPYWVQQPFNRALALTKLNRRNEARRSLRQLSDLFPDDLDVRAQVGSFYIRWHEPENADREFQWVLQCNPQHSAALTGQGAVAFARGQYAEAVATFRLVLEAEPLVPIFHTNLAWALVRQEAAALPGAAAALEEAEELCHEARALYPDAAEQAEALGCLGVIAFKRGSLREAEDYLSESIRVTRRHGQHAELAALYIQMERYDEAKGHLDEALTNNPDDTQARLEMGNLYLLTGKAPEAVREFRQAEALDPTAEGPPRALAVALMRTQRFDDAEKVLRQALRRVDEAQRWRLHVTYCELLTRRGDEARDRRSYEEALKEVNSALRLRPSHPAPHFYAGLVRGKLQDYAKALQSFRRCLQEDPTWYEAELNAQQVQALLREDAMRSGSIWVGNGIAALCLVQLAVVWVLLVVRGQTAEAGLLALIPTLVGLAIMASLLPWLIRLKLPGFEAELSQPQAKGVVTPEAKGEIGFRSPPLTISSGPH
jgi:tetratricopeptide (TPR) repeat protein